MKMFSPAFAHPLFLRNETRHKAEMPVYKKKYDRVKQKKQENKNKKQKTKQKNKKTKSNIMHTSIPCYKIIC